MKRWLGIAGLVVAVGTAAFTLRFSHAPVPAEADLLNPARLAREGDWDVMGRTLTDAEASKLGDASALLSPARHAVRIDDGLIRTGRDAFYRETYGNEVFLTDVLGLLDGGLSVPDVAMALLKLAGRGTADLRVPVARDMQVGARLYKKGETISTGLAVPRGGLFPLGVRTFYDRGHVRMGITCALCHSAVDPHTLKVVEGAPNTRLNVGLMLALASNPAAYWVHGGVDSLTPYARVASRTVMGSDGTPQALPDIGTLAADLRAHFAAWPPGSFDSSPDLVNNPTSIPSSFTRVGWPYGWSGHAGIGPFRGLSALNNNVHSLNSDTTGQHLAAPALFGVDPELYLATILQDAPARPWRFDPAKGGPPSTILRDRDPTPPAPGINSYAVLPTYPRANYVTSDSLIASRPGEPVGYAIDAMSAFQNVLRPPNPLGVDTETLARGRAVFERAGCAACHAGPALTDHTVHSVGAIGTEPSRAKSFARSVANAAPPQIFASDAPFPPAAGAMLVDVPVPDWDQLRLAWASDGQGGYKTPSLLGLAWSAPYLHDGGVAVGPDADRHVGAAILFGGVAPDPRNSLRALVDRELRRKVTAANARSEAARTAHVTGAGHEFWADAQAGAGVEDQNALLDYLLSVAEPR